MENLFDTVVGEQMPTETPEKKGKDNRKMKVDAMKEAFKEVAGTAEFKEKHCALSSSLKVVNSLGYGATGGIVVDKNSDKEGRALAPTSQIVGYRVQNIGQTPIAYTTEVWTKDADGHYVSEKVVKSIAPGAFADLTRQYMTMLCANPEFSFQLANGKMVRGSGNRGGENDIKAELEAHYFSFNKEEQLEINSDEVKLSIAVKGADGKWTVKPEFAEVFGYLDNEKAKGPRSKGEAGPKYNSSDMAANYVMKLMKEANL